jgi:hypothetical protein
VADTVFSDYQTIVPAVWLNDINNLRYGASSSVRGAALLQFMQTTQAAGAAVRDSQSKMREVVSITDFVGADATGATKSTAAMDKAITYLSATGGEIVLPPGNWRIDPLAYSGINGLKIRGSSFGSSLLTVCSTGVGLKLSNCQKFELDNLTVQSEGTAQAIANCTGIQLDTGSGNSLITGVWFQGFSLNGLSLIGTAGVPLSGHKVFHCYGLGNGQFQFYLYYTNDFMIGFNQAGFLGAAAHAQAGYRLENSQAGKMVGNFAWNNAMGCQNLSSNYNDITANRFEESDQYGYYQSGGARTQFLGNTVHTNSQSGTGVYDGAYFTAVTGVLIDGMNTFSFNGTKHANDINIDAGCSQITIGQNDLNNWTASPVRISGGAVSTSTATPMSDCFNSAGQVAAGTTTYLGVNGAKANELDTRKLVRGGRLLEARMYAETDVAPIGAETFTYALMKNGAATSCTFSITGASTVNATSTQNPAVVYSPDDKYSIRLMTSAGAALARHNVSVDWIPY